MPSLDRRTLLSAAATGSLAALAGCSSSCPDSGEPEPDALVDTGAAAARPFDAVPGTDWRAPRNDAGNTGFAREVTPPEPPLGVRWRTSVPTAPTGGTAAPASAPAVADGLVVVATTGGVSALRFRDGAEAWRTTGLTPNTTGPTYGYDDEVVPPVLGGDGTVLVGGRDALVALDPDDGSERWRYTGADGFGPPAVNGGAVYAGASGAVVALDAADGTERWTADVEDAAGLPAVADGAVVVDVDGGTLALEAATGEERWRSAVRGEFYPVAADGLVYLGTYEGLHAVDLSSGDERWRFDRGSGRAFSSPVVADDTLYVVERPGEAGMATFALDRADGAPEPRWCSDVGEGAVTAATADRAFGLLSTSLAPDDEGSAVGLVAFDDRLGDAVWGLPATDRLLPPAVVDGAVVAVDRRGTVRAVGGV